MPEQAESSSSTAQQRRRARLSAGLIAVLIGLPSLGVGWVADDYFHRAFLVDHLATRHAPAPWWNVFDTRAPVHEQIGVGGLPWWTSPHLKVALLRPLATASHYCDYTLWPDQPVWMHLHNVAWYVLLVLVVSALYWKLFERQRLAAWLACLMYAADDAHALGTAWIASRNTLMTALFALLCFWLYVRGRSERKRVAARLAPLALLLSHASSEGAIAIWSYLIAWTVLLDPTPARERLRALLPLAAVSVTWLSLASLLGFGVSGSGTYLDPRSDPGAFLAALPHRLPEAISSQLGISEEFRSLWPAAARHTHDALVWVVFVLGLYLLVRAGRRQPLALFFAFGSLGALLPVCAVGPVGRLLFIGGFGAHGALAMLLAAVPWAAVRRPLAQLARAAGALGVVAIVCAALFGAFSAPRWWLHMHGYFRDKAATLPHGKQLEDSVILIVNTRDYLATPFIAIYRRLFDAPGPIFMHVLGVSTRAVRVSRPDDNSLVLSPERGYLDDATSTLVRKRDEPFTPGQQVPLVSVLVHIERVTEDGRPAQIRLQTFGLSNPRYLWVVWDDRAQGFVPFKLPARGETVVLPAPPD